MKKQIYRLREKDKRTSSCTFHLLPDFQQLSKSCFFSKASRLLRITEPRVFLKVLFPLTRLLQYKCLSADQG